MLVKCAIYLTVLSGRGGVCKGVERGSWFHQGGGSLHCPDETTFPTLLLCTRHPAIMNRQVDRTLHQHQKNLVCVPKVVTVRISYRDLFTNSLDWREYIRVEYTRVTPESTE